jgi:O-antigen/teichoic acid export membrane protein
MATLLRSFKKEPFLVQSLIASSLTLLLVALTARRWGGAGAAFSYLSATAGFALPSALAIFARARRGYLARISEPALASPLRSAPGVDNVLV